MYPVVVVVDSPLSPLSLESFVAGSVQITGRLALRTRMIHSYSLDVDTAADQREVEGQLDQLVLPSSTPQSLEGFSLGSFGPSCRILGMVWGW